MKPQSSSVRPLVNKRANEVLKKTSKVCLPYLSG
nr:MAG TPA: hypothetical protein [Caudoviricetes sp.]